MRSSFLGLVAVVALVRCSIEPCDPGEIHMHGICYPEPTDAAPADGAPTDGGDDAGGCGDDPYSGFGDECFNAKTHEDCQCAADICAGPPYLDPGFCTRIGCLDDETICPPDWECADLSLIRPDVGSVCVQSR